MLEANNVVVIATRNQGKIKEFAGLFRDKGMEVRSLADYEGLPPIVEDGATFAENALIKAKTIASHLGIPVLADDSGLCVDALGGAPGVVSARYAGEHASDADNNRKLLQELRAKLGAGSGPLPAASDAPELLSPAHFVCALALADPVHDRILQVEGRCDGYVIGESRGNGGFGYDPYFFIPELGKTMAELTVEEKNAVSHRAKALRRFFAAYRTE
jgi:XTP/dITP diphosphohydrolase